VFLSPFDENLWIALVGLVVFFGIGLFVIGIIKITLIRRSKVLANKLLDMIVDSLLIPIGIISQQGYHGNFKLVSARILLVIFLLFAFIMGQFYSTYIVGSLLMEAPRTITNMAQLVDSGMPVILENVLYILRYFDSTSDPDSLRLFKRIEKNYNSLLYPPLKGLEMVKKGGFAFHVDPPGVYKAIKETFTESEICDLQEILMFPGRPMFLTVRKGSPIKELISVW
jgi:glutamate receptor, ionotropic, invertebrate